jgi:hypothetical protein
MRKINPSGRSVPDEKEILLKYFNDEYDELGSMSGSLSPSLRCPVTGQLILPGEDEETGEVTSWADVGELMGIRSLRFLFTDVVSEFDFLHEEVRVRLDAFRSGPDASAAAGMSDFELLASGRVPFAKNGRVYAVTSGGGCGPGWVTSWVGVETDV